MRERQGAAPSCLNSRKGRAGQARHRGFALVIVLWVIAGLTVVAAAVASSARTTNESVKLLRDRVRAEAAFMSTAARVEMLAATAPAGRTDLYGARGRLPVDGRPLMVDESETVTVQDLRGLVDLNRTSPSRIEALLKRCGIREADAPKLADALADYVDQDSLKRINGAETFEYRSAGIATPRNSELLSREELWRVLGWQDIRATWNAAGCEQLVTVHGDGMSNRNTAPLQILLTDGMNETTAKALVDARREGLPAVGVESTSTDSSNPFNFAGGGFAGGTMRVVHQATWVEWTFEYELELTPMRNGGPWRLHEVRTAPRPAQMAKALASLPPVDFRNPERDPTLNNAAPTLPFGN